MVLSICLQSSEYSAWSSLYYGRIIKAILASAGHSPDLVSVVNGFADTGKALVSGGVDKVIFTGSPGVSAALLLHCTSLCLGGVNPRPPSLPCRRLAAM